jgi:hypothetical protein
MRPTTLLAAALGTTAALMQNASATPVCAGTTEIQMACVDPLSHTFYSDCVFVGPPPCTPVDVPGAVAWCAGVVDCQCSTVTPLLSMALDCARSVVCETPAEHWILCGLDRP